MQKNKGLQFLNARLSMSIVLLLLLLSGGCSFDTTSTLAHSNDEPMMIRLSPRTFAMNTQGQRPVLQLRGDVCQVHIQSDNGSYIIVHVTVRHYQENPMPTIQYVKSSKSNMLSINEKIPQLTTSSETDSIMVNITVPHNVDLSLSNKVGSFEISSVSGEFAIATSTGSITANNVRLARNSSLSTNVGSISFFGDLAPQGMYSMTTDVGSIDLAFQGSPSLHVAAQANLGSIRSDFPSLNVSDNIAEGTLGNVPNSRLFLRTQVGSISLK